MKTNISKYLLFEYLAGRTNPLERQLVEDWIVENNNSEAFHQWLLEYENKNPQFLPDQEEAIHRLLTRLESDGLATESIVAKTDTIENAPAKSLPTNRKYWLIAASVIMLVSCGWWFREPLLFKSYQTGYGQTTDIYLEDGSKIALNSNSKIHVPRFGFDSDVREVMLEGEAEFAVSHTIDHKRFVVKTSKDFQVEVLGTTFSVFARPRGTKVSLTSGSVRIDYSQNNERKELMMEPGDMAVLGQLGEVFLEKKKDVKTFALWKEQRFVFNATSVKEIAALIEENFGQKVSLSDSNLANRTITGNFKTKSGEELLKTISEVLDIKLEQSGNKFLLTNN